MLSELGNEQVVTNTDKKIKLRRKDIFSVKNSQKIYCEKQQINNDTTSITITVLKM